MNSKQGTEVLVAMSYHADMIADGRRGEGWYEFRLNGWHIWSIKGGWRMAQLIDNHYCNHLSCKALDEAFKAALKK